MTLNEELLVMQLHDGELGWMDGLRAQALLRRSAEARQLARELAAGSDAIRAHCPPTSAFLSTKDDRIVRALRAQLPVARCIRLPQRKFELARCSAVAAACALWLPPTPVILPGRVAPEAAATRPARVGAAEPATADTCHFEAVDLGSGGGTVFVVPVADGVTPVVWLVESDSDQARMRPL